MLMVRESPPILIRSNDSVWGFGELVQVGVPCVLVLPRHTYNRGHVGLLTHQIKLGMPWLHVY